MGGWVFEAGLAIREPVVDWARVSARRGCPVVALVRAVASLALEVAAPVEDLAIREPGAGWAMWDFVGDLDSSCLVAELG